MTKESFFQKYSDIILFSALKIKEDDVLSINTEEEDYAFARLLAEKAKRITGNGSYIQLLKNGRIVESFDILSSSPLTKKPTCFIYLPYYKKKDEIDTEKIYEAKELQNFNLLSDPLDIPNPSFPFVTCPLPNKEWDEIISENDWNNDSFSLLSSILSLEEPDYIEYNNLRHDNLLYYVKELNKLGLKEGRITNDEGTDLFFSFLPESEFASSFNRTTDDRYFSPYIFSSDIFRLIDPMSLSGWLNTSKSVVIWGKPVKNLSLYFENGRVTKYKGNMFSEALFNLYSKQDDNSIRASMLTLSETSHPLNGEEATYFPELDRMRTVSITIGGPKGEAVKEENIEKTIDSITTLSLPIGTDSLSITCIDKDGEERVIYEDGTIIVD